MCGQSYNRAGIAGKVAHTRWIIAGVESHVPNPLRAEISDKIGILILERKIVGRIPNSAYRAIPPELRSRNRGSRSADIHDGSVISAKRAGTGGTA